MAVTFKGYRYVRTSAGNIKIFYLEADVSSRTLSAVNIRDAIGSRVYDGTIGIVRNVNTTLGASGISLANGVTEILNSGGRPLILRFTNNSYIEISNTGGASAAGRYSIAAPFLLKDTRGYQLCTIIVGLSIPTEDVSVLPSANKWGYYVSASPYTFSNSGGYSGATINSYVNEYFQENPPSERPIGIDPYADGGTSTTGGGSGGFSRPSVDINRPGLPGIGEFISETNFVTLYNPNIDQINALASYMWSHSFLDRISKILKDPMSCVIALNIVPINIEEGALVNVSLGNISTTIQMPLIDNQFVELDCGEIDVEEYWGAYLDYSPYTKIELFLPYIGIREIKADDVMNKTIHLSYSIDLLSGACCAFLECDGSVLYQFPGQCAYPVPLSADSYSNTVSALVSLTAGFVTGTMALASGNFPLAMGTLATAAGTGFMAHKEDISHSGSMNGCVGFMGGQTPYLIFTIPRQCVAEDQNKFTGYPSYVTFTLSDLEGFTVIDRIHLHEMSCTDSEKLEIERLLTEGVIL